MDLIFNMVAMFLGCLAGATLGTYLANSHTDRKERKK